MINSTTTAIEAWESEGGAVSGRPAASTPGTMLGTAAEVEWAQAVRRQVNTEFNRVAVSFRAAAVKTGERRSDTEAILAILERKRLEVMQRQEAASFIRDWREIGNQVQCIIGQDSGYKAIRARQWTPGMLGSDPIPSKF